MKTIDELRHYSDSLRGLSDVRLVSLEDGPGRGQRLLSAFNAEGLAWDVAVDRGFDLASISFQGRNLGWKGSPELAFPTHNHDAEDGLGFLRNFDGFLATCGLDHFGLPTSGPADHFIYPNRQAVRYPLHGRYSSLKARLNGYGVDLKRDEPVAWCEGTVRQTTNFGESLVLTRRLEMSIFGRTLSLTDHVTNTGFRPCRHAVLYHFNVGYPLLNEEAELFGSLSASDLEAFSKVPAIPTPDTIERFDPFELLPDELGNVEIGVRSGPSDSALSLKVQFDVAQLPAFGIWRCYQSGIFALGLEPHTKPVDPTVPYSGPGAASFIEPGEERKYALRLTVGGQNVL